MFVLRQEKLSSLIWVLIVSLGVFWAWLAVKPWGLIGVASSWLVLTAVSFTFHFVYLRTRLGLPRFNLSYGCYFALFPLAFVISAELRDIGLGTRLAIHLLLIIGLILVFTWTRLLDWQLLSRIKEAFLKKKPAFEVL